MRVGNKGGESTTARFIVVALVSLIPIAISAVFIGRLAQDRIQDRTLATLVDDREATAQRALGDAVVRTEDQLVLLGSAEGVDATFAALGAEEVRLVDADGTTVWSSADNELGERLVSGQDVAAALSRGSFVRAGETTFSYYLAITDADAETAVGVIELVEPAPVASLAAARADIDAVRVPIAIVALLAWGMGVILLGIVNANQWRRAAEHRQLALHDGLTGLRNRTSFHQRLEESITGAARSKGRVGLILLDLDGFKAINDTGGHAAGDRLLKRVSTKLVGLTRRNEIACRLGGDEFAVLVPSMDDRDELVALANRLHDDLDLMVDFTDGRSLRVTASLGLAVYPDDAGTADDLVSAADVGMYRVKAGRKARMQKRLSGPNRSGVPAWH